MKLCDIKIGEPFKIAGVEFIKFTQDGEKVFAVAKNSLFSSVFGNDENFADSKIKKSLEKDLLPKLEAEIGAENIFEFETDLTALDGTHPFADVSSKVSLVTLDFYRKHRGIFGKYNLDDWWWLVTPDSERFKNIFLCVSPAGDVNNDICGNGNNGVRPILLFSSSILVSCD